MPNAAHDAAVYFSVSWLRFRILRVLQEMVAKTEL